MNERFFDLYSPHDMLRKSEREFDRLKSDLSIDNIFNFFVTAYHVMDYVKTQQAAPDSAIDAMFQDSDLQMCNFICNKGKHLKLTRQTDKETRVTRRPGAVFGACAFNTVAFNAGPLTHFYVDGNEVDIRSLAERVLEKWRTFFADHNIA